MNVKKLNTKKSECFCPPIINFCLLGVIPPLLGAKASCYIILNVQTDSQNAPFSPSLFDPHCDTNILTYGKLYRA